MNPTRLAQGGTRRQRTARRLWRCWWLAAALAVGAVPATGAEYALAPGQTAIGELGQYVTTEQDLFQDIARRFDLGYTELVAANRGVDPWVPGAGRRIILPALYILPNVPRSGIVINLAERRLFYYPPGGDRVQTYPIGIGVTGKTTPLGATTVVRKEANPTWYPPPSIRSERPELPAAIEAGPDNPLGAFALYLGWKNYLIHGTHKPDGVGRNVSHGCIRLYPEDIERLFGLVAAGTPVRVVEQPVEAAWIGTGLYVKAYPSKAQADAISEGTAVQPQIPEGLREAVAAAAGQYADTVDWRLVGKAGWERTGLPVRVGEKSAEAMSRGRGPGPQTAER